MKNKTIVFAVIATLLVSLGAAPPAEAVVALVPAAAVAACLAAMGIVTVGAVTSTNSQTESELAVQTQEPREKTSQARDQETDRLVAMENYNSH